MVTEIDVAGWAESPQVPHLIRDEGLGEGFEAHKIEFAEIDGRPVAVFIGRSMWDVPVQVHDQDTGALLPDRSLLHGWPAPSAMGLCRDGDRTLLATAGVDRVVVRDAATGEPVGKRLRGPEHPVAVAAGVGLVAAANRQEIHVWDLDGTPRATHHVGGHAFVVHGGRLLVVTGSAGQLQVVDVLTGENVGESFSGHDRVVAAVEYRGELLVVSQNREGPNSAPLGWNVSRSAEQALPPLWRAGPEIPATSNGQVWLDKLGLAEVGGELAAATAWYVGGGVRVDVWLPGEEGPRRFDGAWTTAVSSEFIAFAGEYSSLSVGRIASGVPVESDFYGGPMEIFKGLGTFSGRPVAIFSGGRVWDLEAGRPVHHRPSDIPIAREVPRQVAAFKGYYIRITDTASGADVMRIDHRVRHADGVPPYPVTTFALGGTLLATGSKNSMVRVWDVTTGEPIGMPWQGRAGGVSALGVTRWRDRPAVIAAYEGGPPRMWLVDAPPRGVGHTDSVSALAAVVRDGRPGFASADQSGTILFWDPATGRTVGDPIVAHDGWIEGLAFAGGVLISADDDVIQRWDPGTGERIGEPLSVTGGGRLAATGSLIAAITEGHLRVWDAPTGAVVTEMPLPRDAELHALAVADGKLVALTVDEPDEDLFPEAYESAQMVTIWDVTAAAPLLPPLLTTADRGIGTFAEVGGRFVAVQSTDAFNNNGDELIDSGVLLLRDLTTGEHGLTLDRENGWINGIQVAVVRGRPIAFVAAEEGVEAWDLERGEHSAPDVGGLLGSVTCMAVTDVDGVLFVAIGDDETGVNICPYLPDEGP